MNHTPGTLYILDDEPFVRRLLEVIAKTAGFRVRSFGNAVEFLETWSPEMTGCVITDLNMPAISGLELIKRLSERQCAMPVILLSATEDPKLIEEAKYRGAYACLGKPIDKARLLGALREVMPAA